MRYWYFLMRTTDDVMIDTPISSPYYLGDINDYVEIDGIGYIITDYAEEMI